MPQIVRPISDIVVNTWTPVELWRRINDDTDVTFISSENNPSYGESTTCTCGIATPAYQPTTGTGGLFFRARLNGGRNAQVQVLAIGGATLVSPQVTLTSSWQQFAYAFDVADITDYNALRVKIYPETTGGGSPTTIDVSDVWIEFPDAPPLYVPTTENQFDLTQEVPTVVQGSGVTANTTSEASAITLLDAIARSLTTVTPDATSLAITIYDPTAVQRAHINTTPDVQDINIALQTPKVLSPGEIWALDIFEKYKLRHPAQAQWLNEDPEAVNKFVEHLQEAYIQTNFGSRTDANWIIFYLEADYTTAAYDFDMDFSTNASNTVLRSNQNGTIRNETLSVSMGNHGGSNMYVTVTNLGNDFQYVDSFRIGSGLLCGLPTIDLDLTGVNLNFLTYNSAYSIYGKDMPNNCNWLGQNINKLRYFEFQEIDLGTTLDGTYVVNTPGRNVVNFSMQNCTIGHAELPNYVESATRVNLNNLGISGIHPDTYWYTCYDLDIGQNYFPSFIAEEVIDINILERYYANTMFTSYAIPDINWPLCESFYHSYSPITTIGEINLPSCIYFYISATSDGPKVADKVLKKITVSPSAEIFSISYQEFTDYLGDPSDIHAKKVYIHSNNFAAYFVSEVAAVYLTRPNIATESGHFWCGYLRNPEFDSLQWEEDNNTLSFVGYLESTPLTRALPTSENYNLSEYPVTITVEDNGILADTLVYDISLYAPTVIEGTTVYAGPGINGNDISLYTPNVQSTSIINVTAEPGILDNDLQLQAVTIKQTAQPRQQRIVRMANGMIVRV